LCRNIGIGSGALALVMQYAQTHLHLNQVYANIGCDNKASLSLFTKFGFQEIGIKKQWNLVRGEYKDEALYQYIFTK
jgi:diamine N-acetyltransferase